MFQLYPLFVPSFACSSSLHGPFPVSSDYLFFFFGLFPIKCWVRRMEFSISMLWCVFYSYSVLLLLRSIHPGLHYDDILVLVVLQSLKKRRNNICKAYFNRLKRNTHRINHLIPERRDVHYRGLPLEMQMCTPSQ